MSIEELQNWVSQDWEHNSGGMPSVELQLLYIMEELGEVAEAIRKSSGKKERIEKSVDLGSELADLIISITTLANHYEINLETEIEQFKARLRSRQAKQ
ncbi:MAG TPA: MazG nucleotide pyrophosphohydrolase domain-containing protein [Candidatus Saccharibacteria bacterium]|jgi:NTP pyrophosphatase (non-canonical NTP hydrolase)|nr:MazG nucleotide pyrophosphohydrolase domain-containing protein [Candidatus Saccharibacteria bacterium]HMT55266.1 MazG nucleotide pyrophosphohydrolase domain-containing protein [Candidatus Saccharibacteria bacterium]